MARKITRGFPRHIVRFLYLFIFLICFPYEVSAFDLFPGPYLEVEQGFDGKTHIANIGVWDNVHGGLGTLGLKFIDSDTFGNTLGLHFNTAFFIYSIGEELLPYHGHGLFIGEGLFAGYNYDKNRFIGAFYPEVGIHISLAEAWSLRGGAKYYISTDRAFPTYSIGLKWEW